jgi:hypothetical protein
MTVLRSACLPRRALPGRFRGLSPARQQNCRSIAGKIFMSTPAHRIGCGNGVGIMSRSAFKSSRKRPSGRGVAGTAWRCRCGACCEAHPAGGGAREQRSVGELHRRMALPWPTEGRPAAFPAPPESGPPSMAERRGGISGPPHIYPLFRPRTNSGPPAAALINFCVSRYRVFSVSAAPAGASCRGYRRIYGAVLGLCRRRLDPNVHNDELPLVEHQLVRVEA